MITQSYANRVICHVCLNMIIISSFGRKTELMCAHEIIFGFGRITNCSLLWNSSLLWARLVLWLVGGDHHSQVIRGSRLETGEGGAGGYVKSTHGRIGCPDWVPNDFLSLIPGLMWWLFSGVFIYFVTPAKPRLNRGEGSICREHTSKMGIAKNNNTLREAILKKWILWTKSY